MLNKQPRSDTWELSDNVPESQYYGRTFKFDFSFIESTNIKNVVKDYIWHNWSLQNHTPQKLYHDLSRFKHFCSFLEQTTIKSFREMSNSDVDAYMSYLRTKVTSNDKPLSYKYQKACLDTVKGIIVWGQIHRPKDVPDKPIFLGNEYTGTNRHMKIDFIPDEILHQINEALKFEENPYLKYGIIILESTGMRIGDLLKLRTDCIKPHLVSGYTISWFDHKNHKERPAMPVRKECAIAVQKLIEVTAPLRDEAEENIKDILFIYRCPKGHCVGKVTVPYPCTLWVWLTQFTKNHNILEADGQPYRLTSHQFRRTLGTDMLSKGTDINVIQQVLGHATPLTTKNFYADVKDKERAETFKNIGIIGNINLLDKSAFQNESELKWFRANKDTSACLCDGYCTKPFANGEICDRLLRRQKCYTCSRYVTTPEYLEAHRKHLEGLERQVAEGAIYGEHYAEHFMPTIEILKVIIERLEELQNDRVESGAAASTH